MEDGLGLKSSWLLALSGPAHLCYRYLGGEPVDGKICHPAFQINILIFKNVGPDLVVGWVKLPLPTMLASHLGTSLCAYHAAPA